MTKHSFYRKGRRKHGVMGEEAIRLVIDRETQARKRQQLKIAGFFTDEEKKRRPITAPMPMEELRARHERRSYRAKVTDEALEAQIAKSPAQWVKAPNEYDIRGIDLFPMPLGRDFNLNCNMMLYNFQQYHDIDLSKVVVYGYTTDTAFNKEYHGDAKDVYAFARQHTIPPEIHFSPKCVRYVAKGRITDGSSFHAYMAVAHEIGHITGNAKVAFQSAIDEGANDLLASRWVMNNVQMNRNIRRRSRKDPPISYLAEVKLVSNLAILMANGDTAKAMKWLEVAREKDLVSQVKHYEKAQAKLYRILKKNRIADPGEKSRAILLCQANNYPRGSYVEVANHASMLERLVELEVKYTVPEYWWAEA